jgi:basic membrane protein A and related proteins
MTDLSKRSIVKMVALTAVATAALVGCGKKEEAPKAEAPAAAPAKAEPLKIAFAYVGPVGDGGWTFAHDNGRKEIEKAFGDKVVTSFVGRARQQTDFRHHLRLHGADAQSGR